MADGGDRSTGVGSFPIDTDRAASGYPDSASDTLDEPLLPLPDVEAAHDKDNTADTETVLKINEEHEHYSDRAPWLRAAVLGANDGLVSVASLILGVGAGTTDLKVLALSGCSALVAGALSMGVGEYISVSSQRDTEQADIEVERREQEKGPEARARELEELISIYQDRGLDYDLAKQVAVALSRVDPVRTHVRDELGIDMDELANPLQAAVASMASFVFGAAIPLLAAIFIKDAKIRLGVTLAASTVGLALFGAIGAWLGGAHKVRASGRVLVGGLLAMGITFGIGKAFGTEGAA